MKQGTYNMTNFKNINEALEAFANNEITWEKFTELKEVYDEAYKDAINYGFVGVGKISFACSLLQDHQGMSVDPIRIPQMYTDEDFT